MTTIQTATLDLLKTCVNSDSITRNFYASLLIAKDEASTKTLAGRALEFCGKNGIDIVKYVLNDKYAHDAKSAIFRDFHVVSGVDGLIDSLRNLLYNNYNYEKRSLANNMLKAF